MLNKPNVQIQIAEVLLEELEDLKLISEETFIDTYASFNTKENMAHFLEEAYNRKRLTTELSSADYEYYFARIDENIVGYIKLNYGLAQTELKEDTSIEIERIYVLKDQQGKKIGQSLFEFTVSKAREKGLKSVWLGVWEQNPKAIAFYKKMGLQAFDTHDFKLGDELQTDILMRYTL